MRHWFCSDCGHRQETPDEIVFSLCKYCIEKMELDWINKRCILCRKELTYSLGKLGIKYCESCCKK